MVSLTLSITRTGKQEFGRNGPKIIAPNHALIVQFNHKSFLFHFHHKRGRGATDAHIETEMENKTKEEKLRKVKHLKKKQNGKITFTSAIKGIFL